LAIGLTFAGEVIKSAIQQGKLKMAENNSDFHFY